MYALPDVKNCKRFYENENYMLINESQPAEGKFSGMKSIGRINSDKKNKNSTNKMSRSQSYYNVFTSNKAKTNRAEFVAVTSFEDTEPIRCAEFSPDGYAYAIGSNSKNIYICKYRSPSKDRYTFSSNSPTKLFTRKDHHKGSIYCLDWSPCQKLLATGSNDKSIKIMRYNQAKFCLEGKPTELAMHDGTIRDLCFLDKNRNNGNLLLSGGAGDCKLYVTDCEIGVPILSFSGHGDQIRSICNCGGEIFVSGSQDKTVRFWDLRMKACVKTVLLDPNFKNYNFVIKNRQKSAICSVCVDPSGRLLISGNQDGTCHLYDIRGNKTIQSFQPHTAEIRSVKCSPSAYYLLTAGYDHKLVLTDLQGDLTNEIASVEIAHHQDKVVSCCWHPNDYSFLSTSADKTAILWALSSD